MTTARHTLSRLFARRRSRPARAAARPDEEATLWRLGSSIAYHSAVERLVGVLLRDGVRTGTSVMRLEPRSRSVVVSYHAEQATHERVRLPRHLLELLMAHLRFVAGMDKAEGHYPQQGCFIALFDAVRYGILITITLTPWGERAELSMVRESAA